MNSGSICVIGIGPGSLQLLTPEARESIETADVILGYSTYLDLIQELAPEVTRESSGMREEVRRVRRAIDLAQQGRTVALISGGDAGVYGMAGLVYEMLAARKENVAVRIIPGISAVNAAAALLGAPLMTDFAAISLSDQLVPLDEIIVRLERAIQADFVIALYNPKGRKRTKPFERACQVLAQNRRADTPVGVVRSAFREGQKVTITTLSRLPEAEVDMLSIIIVGNSHTYVYADKMITPRGYGDKYDLEGVPEDASGSSLGRLLEA